jgi:hypothetical protein
MDLYYAVTQYHILLSIALANKNTRNNNVLVVSTSNKGAACLASAISHSNDSPFSDVAVLSDSYGVSRFRGRTQRVYSSLVTMAKTARSQVRTVYVFNDKAGDAQAVMYFSRLFDTDVQYVEDGAAAYSSSDVSVKCSEAVLKKIIFGPWWKNVDVFATTGYGNRIWLTHPELARPELNHLEHCKINSNHLAHEADSEWLNTYVQKYSNWSPAADLESIVLLPLSPTKTDLGRLQEHIKVRHTLTNSGRNIAVKFHPRESDYGVFPPSITSLPRIPQQIPAEVVFLYIDNLRSVTAGLSTSLLSAAWLLDDIELLSFNEVDGGNNLAKVFKLLGIRSIV